MEAIEVGFLAIIRRLPKCDLPILIFIILQCWIVSRQNNISRELKPISQKLDA